MTEYDDTDRDDDGNVISQGEGQAAANGEVTGNKRKKEFNKKVSCYTGPKWDIMMFYPWMAAERYMYKLTVETVSPS